jgi:hypothetical protein
LRPTDRNARVVFPVAGAVFEAAQATVKSFTGKHPPAQLTQKLRGQA